MIRYILPAVLTVLCVGISESNAQRIPSFNQRPAVSPYIQLFNNNQGGINNYFSFVRPQQQQQRFNQQQMMQNRMLQQQAFGGMGGGNFSMNQQTSGLLRPTNAAGMQPTAPASYFNYSHYYNQPVNMQQGIGGGRRLR